MTSGTYRQILTAATGCDSTVVLHLTVNDTTTRDVSYYLCDGETYTDVDFPDITAMRDTSYVKRLEKANAVGCDSVVYVSVRFGRTYVGENMTHDRDTTLCEREGTFVWYTYDSHSETPYVNTFTWDDLAGVPINTVLYDTLKTVDPFNCDSVTSIRVTVNPTTYETISPVVCSEDLPYQSDQDGKIKYATEIYNDTLTNRYGCDSILTVNLTVLDSIVVPVYVDICDDVLPYNHPTEERTLHDLYTTGIYRDTLTAASSCDSVVVLHLNVHQTFPIVTDTTRIEICDNESYHFLTADIDTVYNLHKEWASADKSVGTFILTGQDTTIWGCDSAVAHVITVYPTYEFLQDTMVCQDRQMTDWPWIDEFGEVHNNVHISIADSGTFTFVDTLYSDHGCEMLYGMRVRVAPTYYFPEETIVICQDDRADWQGRGYSGDKYGWGTQQLAGDRYDEHLDSVYYHYLAGDTILGPGVYYDTAHYFTVDGCDSIYYLKLIVNPAGHFVVDAHACDKDSFYVFEQTEDGVTYRDTIFFSPITRMLDETRKDTLYYERERAIDLATGCHKTMHYHLTVHPTYEYITKAQICWNDVYAWRGKKYAATGVYFDTIPGGTEHWGCDSVYVLELYKRPVKHSFRSDTICDNETYMHTDTIWYDEKRFTTADVVVWRPGESRGDSVQFIVYSADGMCDSIIYHYYLKINKSYIYFDTASICSNVSYVTPRHTYVGYEHEYDVDRYIAPYDTIIKNEYQTINNCDSIYHLYATIYPNYRHRDTITICDDETADWRGHHYAGSMLGNVFGNGLPAGEHVFRDSLLTHDHGCDSIYELHLMVMPTYLFVDSITKCADEDLSWRSFNLDHVLPGEYFYYDSLTTVIYGCDSVYHLYLNVLDTTYEIRHDSICETETYYLHGVALTEPGFYKDTTLNAWGCHHFTYLYLYVIPPTVPTAWADSICADDKSYELFYSYTGPLDPVAYSVYYDDFGHKYGFEDIINEPITTADQLHTLILPMPWRDDDYHKYPRPDYYNIRLTLDNGVCTNPDLCSTDTSIVLSYPSWVTEQRFRDVIAILSTDYNGGYTFSHYQWYRNNQPIPGETLPYLYIPRGLEQDTTWYHVRVVRVGETQDFQTCPIRIYDDFGTDTIAPYMGYLSVVPTCISTSNPVMSILSRHEGYYRIYNETGLQLATGVFRPEVTEVTLYGMAPGVYFVLLDSDATPEEPHRSIKILLKDGDRTW